MLGRTYTDESLDAGIIVRASGEVWLTPDPATWPGQPRCFPTFGDAVPTGGATKCPTFKSTPATSPPRPAVDRPVRGDWHERPPRCLRRRSFHGRQPRFGVLRLLRRTLLHGLRRQDRNQA